MNLFRYIFKQGKRVNSKNETLSFFNQAIYQTAQKEGKFKCIILNTSTQKDMFNKEVWVPNYIIV